MTGWISAITCGSTGLPGGMLGGPMTYDAVELCRILSGRPAATDGVLSVQVPF